MFFLFCCRTVVHHQKQQKGDQKQDRGQRIQLRTDSFSKLCIEHGGEGVDPGTFREEGDGEVI